MSFIIVKESPYIKENNFLLCVPPRHDIIFCVHVGKEVQAWKKNILPESPQRYEIGGRVFIVEPRYRKDGESMADILLKLMLADLDEEMRVANKTITD